MSEPQTCPHCASTSPRNDEGRVDFRTYVEEGPNGWELTYSEFVLVQRCPACQHLIISDCTFLEEVGDLVRQQLLFPACNGGLDLPPRVVALWGAARRTLHGEPATFVTAARRTIEAVCNTQGGEGRDLYNKLRDSEERQLLSPEVVAMGHRIRRVGRLGAHDDVVDATTEDAEVVKTLLETVLDEVYRRPAQLARAKALLAGRPV